MSEIITNYFEIPHGEDSSFSDLTVKTTMGWVTVLTGGTISDSVATEDSSIEIMDGGTFNNATVSDEGTIWIRNGGVLSSGLATNDGIIFVEFDPGISDKPGFIRNVLVTENGFVQVNGSAMDLTVENCGEFDIVGLGKLNRATILDGGFGTVRGGASATDVTVKNGGEFDVYADGTACDLTVAPGGSLSVAAGGKLTGAITFEAGALVSAEEGAILDFDLTQAGVGAKAPLLNDLSFVPDAFHFTLTVDSSLFDGTYKLAGNAAGFDKTISVVNTSGGKLGELKLGDDPVTIDKITYRLSVANNTLSLSLTNENERPTPTIVYVNSEWASLRPNTGVRIGDISAKIGYNAFATGDEAVASIGGDTSVSRELVFLSDGSAASLAGFDSIRVDADSLVSLGGTFTGNSITIDATGYANYTKKVLVSKGGFAEGTSISVIGDGFNYDYLGDDTLLIISPTVGNTYANADWTEADIENQFSDDGTLLVWETNAFSSFFWAGKKLGNTGTIYLTGGTSSESIYLQNAENDVVVTGNTACTVAGYVNGNGGTLTVEGEFIAIGISGFSLLTVKAGGSLTVKAGGITLTEDGIFEFDITDVGAGNEKALVNNLSNVFNSPTYRVTLSDDQARGVYMLATEAEVFINDVMIKGCALKPNGGAVIIGGNSYEITLADDKLFLTIAERPAPGFVYVNTAWAGLDNDTEVTVGDDTFCIGYDAFSTGDAAAAAPGDGMVTVLAGGVSFMDPVEKKLTVRDGAAITGRAMFMNDVVLEGALVFDTSYADEGNIQFSGLSHVSPDKSAKFTLTVSDTQAEGVYRLADEAAGFDKAISVVNTSGTALGTLTVGGDAQEFGGMKYALTLNKNNVLALVVGDVDPNVLTGNLTCAYELTDGMLASNISIKEGGELYVSKGGVANVTTVDPGGILFVFEGGTATQVREDGGCVDVREGATVEFVPNTFGGSTFSDYGWHTVHSGTVASDLTIENDACLEVYGGGIVRNTTLNYGGEATIIADGVANGITVKDGGDLGVGAGGKLTGKMTFETGAIFYVETGAIIDFDLTQTSPDAETALVNDLSFVLGEPFCYTLTVADVQENGKFKLAECAAGFDQTITVMNTSGETLGTLTVGEGAKMLDDGGEYTLTLSEEGLLGVTIFNPNIFTGVVENGTKDISSPISAVNVIVNEFSTLNVHDGGIAGRTTVNEYGRMNVSAGGVASDTIVNDNGQMYVYSGGIASQTTVNTNGELNVSDGGIASKITVNPDGKLNVSKGGVASDTTVNSGGYMFISGGVVSDTTVSSGAEVSFYAPEGGGKLTGKMTFEAGAKAVSVETGGTIDFDLRQTTAGADALLNDFLFVMDEKLSFTLTVDGTQTDGVYSLAGNAKDFGGRTITVVNASDEALDTLKLGGGTKTIDGVKYTLILDSATLAVVVGDYDSTPPTVTGVKADITAPTNQNVTVTADFADETELKSSLYKLDNGDWKAYPEGGVTVDKNVTVTFKAVDAAGNESAEVSYNVTNIDRTPPANPTASADVTAPTNGDVTVTAVFSEDSAKKEYSLDGTTWKAYTGPILFMENGTVYFRGADAAGNPSGITKYEVENIQKGPEEPDNDELVYKDKSANTKVTESYGTHLSTPGDEIRLDRIGSVEKTIEDEKGVKHTFHNHVEKKVDEKIDVIDYAKIVLDHGAKLSFHAEASAAATFTVYSLSEKKGKYTTKKLLTLKLTDKDKDGLFTADSKKLLQLQVSGDYYVSMQFTDRKAADAYYNVSLNGAESSLPSEFEPYSLGDNTDDWGDMKTAGWGGAVADLGTVTDSGNLITDEWIGFGDKVDYKKFTLADAAQLDFSFNTPGGFVKFTVCRLKETEKRDGTKTYSQVTVKTVTATAAKPTVTINDLRLKAGDYFIKVESTNIKKCTGYDVQVTKSTFYADGDGGWNNVLLNKKALDENAQYFYDNTLIDKGKVCFDKAGDYRTSKTAASYTFEAKSYSGFVGFGDELDFAKLTVTKTVDVTFSLLATNDATLEVIQVTKKGEDKYTKKSLQTIKYKQGNEDPATSKKSVTLEARDGVEYYVSVKATNIKKISVDPKTYYNVTYAIDTHEAASLAMPETSDILAMTDSLSLGNYAEDTLVNASMSSLAELENASTLQPLALLA